MLKKDMIAVKLKMLYKSLVQECQCMYLILG